MSRYAQVQQKLRAAPQRWLVTGAAGFIGSHLVQRLLELEQHVVGLDNLSTGHARNLEQVERLVTARQWSRFDFREGDICDAEACRRGCAEADIVLHQAALGSVPRSMADPASTHHNNVTGFVQLLIAAHQAGIRRLVYASSSSVYGDDPAQPKREDKTGQPLSPYAASKIVGEIYAQTFARCYGLASVGLRYFNVFGPRQDPEGAYAAVIPKWITSLLRGEPICINGDGQTSRDFCFIENVVQANLLAATTPDPEALNQVYNVAVGEKTTLLELLRLLRQTLGTAADQAAEPKIIYQDFRAGDVRHSSADISKARERLGYEPVYRVAAGLAESMAWYRSSLAPSGRERSVT